MLRTYAIPCNHPACRDGLFYMNYELADMHDNHHYFLADTQKMLELIAKDDPKMVDHAKWKYEGDTPESWLKSNNENQPCSMGVFAFDENVNWEERLNTWQRLKNYACNLVDLQSIDRSKISLPPAFTMSGGDAGKLMLIHELNLRYVPISVYKQPQDEQTIGHLKSLIGANPDDYSPMTNNEGYNKAA